MLRFVNRVARLPAAIRLPRVSFYSTTANPPTSDVDIKFQVSYDVYTTNTDPTTTPDFAAAAAKVFESCANSMHVDVKKTDNGNIFNVHELNKISSKQLLNRISILLDEPTTQIKDVNILAGKVDTKHKYNLNLSIKRVWTEKAAAKENSTPEKMEKEIEMEGSKKTEKKYLEKKIEMEMEGSKKMEEKDLEKKMEKKDLEKKMEMEGSKKMEKKDLEKKMEEKDLEKKKDLEVSKTYEMVDEKFMIWKLCKLFTKQNEEVVALKVRMRKKNEGVKHSDSIEFVVERPTEEQSLKMEKKDSEKKKNLKGSMSSTTSQEVDEVYLTKIFFALLSNKNVEIAEVKVRMRKNEGGVKHSNLIHYAVEIPAEAY